MDDNSIINQIDAVHAKANRALRDKDFRSYMAVFNENLNYRQLNGKTITKRQLSNDIEKYFRRIRHYSGSFERVSYSIHDNLFIEKLTQKATVEIRLFVFFTKNWTLERQGSYQWKNFEGSWQITDVEITIEKLK